MACLEARRKFHSLDTTLGNMSIKTSRSSRIIDLSIYKTSAKSFDKISSTVLLVKFSIIITATSSWTFLVTCYNASFINGSFAYAC